MDGIKTQMEIDKEIKRIPELMGTIEIARKIGWVRAKVSVYHERKKLPEPATHIGKRPFWTKSQIDNWIATTLPGFRTREEIEMELKSPRN